MFAVWFALASPALGQTWPAGEVVPDAAAAHVTRSGFVVVADQLPALVPADPVDVEPTSDSGGWGCVNYAYTLQDAWVGIRPTGAEIVPRADALDVKLHLDVWINDPSDTFLLTYELFCSTTDCPGYVDTFPVTATVPFALQVIPGPDGQPMLDAVMGAIAIDNGLASEDIHLDCNIDDMETVLNFFGLSIYDLVIGLAEDQIAAQLEDQRAELEATLEEALAAARIDVTTDVSGIPLRLALHPSDVEITADGLALGMRGLAEAPASGCVDAFDPGGSSRTDAAAPGVADDPAGTHLGLLLSDDLVDQALYALWRGGLLCYDLTESEDVPLDLTTSLLGVLGGERMEELWPDGDEPMIVLTEPRQAPVVDYAGDHDLTVVVGDLGIEFFAELDHRTVHALGVGLDVRAGVDVAFDGETGAAAVAVDVGEGAITTRVVSNEFAPGAEAQIVGAFGGLVDNLVGGLLGDALGGLAFSLPAMDGLGLTALDLAPAGDGTWLGAWAQLGPVAYTGDAEGCGGGCASGGAGGIAGLGIVVIGLARRRR